MKVLIVLISLVMSSTIFAKKLSYDDSVLLLDGKEFSKEKKVGLLNLTYAYDLESLVSNDKLKNLQKEYETSRSNGSIGGLLFFSYMALGFVGVVPNLFDGSKYKENAPVILGTAGYMYYQNYRSNKVINEFVNTYNTKLSSRKSTGNLGYAWSF